MCTSAVGIPEEKGPFIGSVPWLVFGTAPMVLTAQFEQIWSIGLGKAPLVLAGPLGPIGQLVVGSEPSVSWDCRIETRSLAQGPKKATQLAELGKGRQGD